MYGASSTGGSFWRVIRGVFIIELTYQAPLADIDRLLPAHLAHLDEHYSTGMFLVSGGQHPRTGGVILATGTRADVEAVAAVDPFVSSGAATARVIEFLPSRVSPNLSESLTPGR